MVRVIPICFDQVVSRTETRRAPRPVVVCQFGNEEVQISVADNLVSDRWLLLRKSLGRKSFRCLLPLWWLRPFQLLVYSHEVGLPPPSNSPRRCILQLRLRLPERSGLVCSGLPDHTENKSGFRRPRDETR